MSAYSTTENGRAVCVRSVRGDRHRLLPAQTPWHAAALAARTAPVALLLRRTAARRSASVLRELSISGRSIASHHLRVLGRYCRRRRHRGGTRCHMGKRVTLTRGVVNLGFADAASAIKDCCRIILQQSRIAREQLSRPAPGLLAPRAGAMRAYQFHRELMVDTAARRAAPFSWIMPIREETRDEGN